MTNLNQQYKDAAELYNAGKHAVATNRLYKLALRGNAWSMDAIGRLYERTVGDDRYWYRQAAFWFHQAAKRGDADAQYSLFRLYHKGIGVKQDDQKACKWFLASAAQRGVNFDEDIIQELERAVENEEAGSLALLM